MEPHSNFILISISIYRRMQRLDSETHAGLVRTFYQNENPASAGIRRFKTGNDLRKDPCTVSTVSRLIDQFEAFGCFCDRPRSVRPSFSEEEIQRVEAELKDQASSDVSRVWYRVAADVTHFGGRRYFP